MKKCAIIFAALAAASAAAAFENFTMLYKGAINYATNDIQSEFAGDYQQNALKSPKVEEDAYSYKITGDFIVKASESMTSIDEGGSKSSGGRVAESKPAFAFEQKVSAAKGGIEFEASFASKKATFGNEKPSLVFYLPKMLFNDRVWIDDEKIKNPEPEAKNFLAKKIRIVSPYRVLEVSGEFECGVSRTGWCPQRGNGEYICVRIKYLKESDTRYWLKLKMRDVPTCVATILFKGINLEPTGFPVPRGAQNLACVLYEIPNSAKALSIPPNGEFLLNVGARKNAKYLEILNGFESFAKDAESVGTVVVNYTRGAPQTFNLKASDTGELYSETIPANATRAWHSEVGGKSAALYTTELGLDKRPVKSIKFVNSSGGAWRIMAATLSRNKIGAIENGEYFVMPSDTYRPIVYKRPALKGSALDLSGFLDAPAGKYGRVKVVDGKFVFEKTGKPVRFYGANNCGTTHIPSHEEAEALAEQFARLGLNVLRIHHYDRLVSTSKNGDSAELDPEAMEKFDYMFNEMKKRGIYITTDFFTGRRLLRKEYDDIDYEGENMKLVFAASEKAIDNFNRFVKNLLTHVNPYTGLAYKDDPALFSVVVRNESSYVGTSNFVVRTPIDREAIQPKFEKWLAKNREKWNTPYENELFQLFMLDSYDHTHGRIMKQIRELAPDLLVSDQNHWGGFLTKAMSKTYDFTSFNAYYGHPIFPAAKFSLPQYIRSDSPILTCGGWPAMSFGAQIFDKPLIITEWCYVPPNKFANQGIFMTAAYGSLNDIGGLCYFAFTHSKDAILTNRAIGGFDFASDPIMSFAHRAGAMLFLRGDVAPASVSFPVVLLHNYYRNGQRKFYAWDIPGTQKFGLVGRLGYVVSDTRESAKIPENASAVIFSEPAWRGIDTKGALAVDIFDGKNGDVTEQLMKANLGKGKIDLKNEFYVSSTGEISLDAKRACWKAITPNSETFLLNEGQKLAGDFASAKSQLSAASVFISSVDGKPLNKSKRILIFHLTDVKNTRQKFGDDSLSLLLSQGFAPTPDTPTLVRAGKVQITVNSPLEGYKLYALDTDGSRLFEAPVRGLGRVSVLNLSIHNKQGSVLAYELVKE